MKDKTFFRLLIAVVTVGVLLTALHTGYILYAYKNASIIYFVSQEIWP